MHCDPYEREFPQFSADIFPSIFTPEFSRQRPRSRNKLCGDEVMMTQPKRGGGCFHFIFCRYIFLFSVRVG